MSPLIQGVAAPKHPSTSQSLSVSVVMATFNGADYLREQLNSLFGQTRLPNELVVYDDGSSDDTWSLLQDYAAKAPFEMKVLGGHQNRGVNAAFRSALIEASGDVIFFCDQDDIWLPTKIEAMLAALDATPLAGFVFCDAVQFVSPDRSLPETLWTLARFTPARQARFRQKPLETMISGGNVVYGMASAFRRDVIEPFMGIEAAGSVMTHDTWFALCATASGRPGLALPQKLVAYRRHARQTSVLAGRRPENLTTRSEAQRVRFEQEIEAFRLVRQSVSRFSLATDLDLTTSLAILDRKIAFLEARAALRRERSAKRAFSELFNRDYWRMSRGVLSVLRDYRGIW
ncbi:glycosyltransferase [Rhizobium wuzhouense]|uniref:glycosyltransferase n=1 Tax=Rhizobium wuzhouense TaxID=1986026 RepID=UPI001401DD3F|nr:glycosyltransferase [Rhizobium wuzhouense]